MNSQGDRATIRLLLADDQALVRGALAALLDLDPTCPWWPRSVAATRWCPPFSNTARTSRFWTSRCPAGRNRRDGGPSRGSTRHPGSDRHHVRPSRISS